MDDAVLSLLGETAESICAAKLRARLGDEAHLVADLDEETQAFLWLWLRRNELAPRHRDALREVAPDLCAALDQVDVEMRAAAGLRAAFVGVGR
jgi:hypothetical protein